MSFSSLILSWVGVVWDGHMGLWSPQQKLIERIQAQARVLATQEVSSRRQWEAFLGLVAFAAQNKSKSQTWVTPSVPVRTLRSYSRPICPNQIPSSANGRVKALAKGEGLAPPR